jgi:cytochrome bd-type quinol oxidase subunit 2
MSRNLWRSVFWLCLAVGATTQGAFAHQKWFHESQEYPLRFDLLLRPLPLLFVAAVVVAVALLGALWRWRGRSFVPGPESLGASDERRAFLYGLVPLILGIHIAVPLLVNGVQGACSRPTTICPLPGLTSSAWHRLALP